MRNELSRKQDTVSPADKEDADQDADSNQQWEQKKEDFQGCPSSANHVESKKW